MADLDVVLERLENDAEFRARVAREPAAALRGFDLSIDDLELIAQRVDVARAGGPVRRFGDLFRAEGEES